MSTNLISVKRVLIFLPTLIITFLLFEGFSWTKGKKLEKIEEMHMIFLSPEDAHKDVLRSSEGLVRSFKVEFPTISETDLKAHIISINVKDDTGFSDVVIELKGQDVDEHINKLVNDHQIKHFMLFEPHNYRYVEHKLNTIYRVILIDVIQGKQVWSSEFKLEFNENEEYLDPEKQHIKSFINQLKEEGLIM